MLAGDSHKFLEFFNIIFACADISIVFIELLSDFFFLAELSSSIEEGSEEHPDVDEST